MSDFIHKREFIVYSPLGKPTPLLGLPHFFDTESLSIVMFDTSGSSTLDGFKFRDI